MILQTLHLTADIMSADVRKLHRQRRMHFNSRNLLVNFVLILPRMDRRKLQEGGHFQTDVIYQMSVPTWKLHTIG